MAARKRAAKAAPEKQYDEGKQYQGEVAEGTYGIAYDGKTYRSGESITAPGPVYATWADHGIVTEGTEVAAPAEAE